MLLGWIRSFSKRTPSLWFDNPENIVIQTGSSSISVHHRKGINPVQTVILIALGVIFAGVPLFFFVGEAIILDSDGDSNNPCWPNEDDAMTLPDGDVFCNDGIMVEKYTDYQIAEGHYRYEYWGEVEEYRWSEENGTITYSWILGDNDQYECYQYRRASSLPENWTGEELLIHYGMEDEHFPTWCNQEIQRDGIEYQATESAPFEGELLYHVEIDDELWGISTVRYTTDGDMILDYYYRPMGPGGFPVVVLSICVLTGLGVSSFALFYKRRVLTFDRYTNLISSKHLKWPRFRSLSMACMEPIQFRLEDEVRIQHHSSGENDSWTTEHPGINVMVNLVGHGEESILFLESSSPEKARIQYESFLNQLATTMGMKEYDWKMSDEEDSQFYGRFEGLSIFEDEQS